ncbi:unnamed protein product, partial [Dovyalis caffra]
MDLKFKGVGSRETEHQKTAEFSVVNLFKYLRYLNLTGTQGGACFAYRLENFVNLETLDIKDTKIEELQSGIVLSHT